MRTLYLRNVPDEVVERLERMAARDSMSVNAVAVRELAEASRQVDNAELLSTLPSFDISTAEIVAAIEEGRAER
jgi:plasmid stability protein